MFVFLASLSASNMIASFIDMIKEIFPSFNCRYFLHLDFFDVCKLYIYIYKVCIIYSISCFIYIFFNNCVYVCMLLCVCVCVLYFRLGLDYSRIWWTYQLDFKSLPYRDYYYLTPIELRKTQIHLNVPKMF